MNKQPLALDIAAVTLSDLNLLLYRNSQVKFPLLRVIDELIERDIEARQVKHEHEHDAALFSIGNIRLGGNSSISLIDESVEPALVQKLSDIYLHMGALNNALPNAKTPLQFNTRVGDFGLIDLNQSFLQLK